MDRLERDRDFGYAVMEECKIDVPQTESFNSFADGIDFVESNPDVRWVYKPSKQLGDLSPSHVSYDTEDMVQLLTNIEQDVDISDPQFELQAFEKGVAMSTELWFQNGEFIAPLTNHTLERKELMNDDLGPSGGCLGNIVWLCDGCPICDVAKRLVPWCEQHRYHGMLDLNVIVAKDTVYGLEFTPRFGYDASPTFLMELVRGDLGDFFSDIANSRLRDVDTIDDAYAGAVRVTIPPWPTEKYHAEENVPIRGLAAKDKDVYLYNVKADKDNELVSAGAWGILALLTHRAGTVNGALRGPLERCKELKIKNKQFRTDLATQFNADLAKLEVMNAVY
jgi:phosphoribosylamine-glycine ligase